MSAILAATLSIFALSGLAWAARKVLRLPICPICFGVGGTWLWMIIGRALGYQVDATVLAILLGGSVAGIAYLVEKRLPQARSALLWKALFIPIGFVAAYGLVAAQWALLAVTGVALALLAAFFLLPAGAPEKSQAVEELKEKMRKCC